MSTSTKKTTKGKRYSAEEKNDIVSFVQKYNEENGRGGQSAASKKYGISQLSVSSWLKAGGEAAPTTGAKRGRKPGSVNKVKGAAASKGGSYAARLSTLSALANQIDKAEAELDKLKAKFQSLKGSL